MSDITPNTATMIARTLSQEGTQAPASNHIIHTTCAYCGVGCGIEAEVKGGQAVDGREVIVKGDAQHPANFGRLCSKGSALGETLDLSSRLLVPEVRGKPSDWHSALDEVAGRFRQVIDEHGPEAVAFYGSGQLLTEDYYVANKLMKGFIGVANIDTNSRLCMSSSVAGHKRAFGADTVPACYEDFEHAELIILIGSNAAWCHPVSFQRIKAAKANNPRLKVVVIDPRRTDSCDIADLHLGLNAGSDVALFNGLLAHLSTHDALDHDYIAAHTQGFDETLAAAREDAPNLEAVARLCGIERDNLATFYDWFTHTDKTLSLYSQGVNQSSSGTDKVSAILHCHLATGRIGKPGSGPLSLTGQPNAMGGREVGGLAHQLAAHMDFTEQDIDRVGRFWQSPGMASQAGYTATELFDAMDEGKIKAVWIMATNPVVSLPDANKVKRALQKCEFVVVSDCVNRGDTLDLADVKLPALGWSEKDGTVTNTERRISRQRALFAPAGEAKPDWWIICEVAKRLGFKEAFDYANGMEIFREHARLSAFENGLGEGLRRRDFNLSGLVDISQDEYDQLSPQQWPILAAAQDGQLIASADSARFFAEGGFFTANGKANFTPVKVKNPAYLPSAKRPLVLNTGRLRDQWHTMTRTALAPRLNQHKPEPFIDIHGTDAEARGLSQGQLAEIESDWGRMLARVNISDRQSSGDVFVPMHWTEQFSRQGRMGVVVNPAIDPISKQPECKYTPVEVRPFKAAWHGFIISRSELGLLGSQALLDDATLTDVDYRVKVVGQGYYLYELAGTTAVDWQHWLSSRLSAAALTWQGYEDSARGLSRSACFSADKDGAVQLEAVIVIGADEQLPERHWLTSLFAPEHAPVLSDDERKALLSGRPPVGAPDVGQIVCACFSVGEKTIRAAIQEQGLDSAQAVGKACKAGTNCGSCVPEIKALLADEALFEAV